MKEGNGGIAHAQMSAGLVRRRKQTARITESARAHGAARHALFSVQSERKFGETEVRVLSALQSGCVSARLRRGKMYRIVNVH